MSTTTLDRRQGAAVRLPLAKVHTRALRVLTLGWVRDGLVVGWYMALTAVLFKDAWLNGLFFKEFDTTNFYYPALWRIREAIQTGTLSLWAPEIFAGFPLEADGESGLLYPPVILVLALVPADAGLTWLRAIHWLLASSFAYGFLRSIGLGRWAGAIGGVAFAYGSFLVMQMHHMNVVHSAVWLPFILWFTERWLRRAGARRAVDVTLAIAGFAMLCLGVHVQVVLMTLLAYAAWTTFRVLARPVAPLWSPRTAPPPLAWAAERLGLLLLAGLVIPLAGAGVAAAQLLPLYEVAAESWRGNFSNIGFSSSYNDSWFNLSNLVLPYLFRDRERVWWTLWSEWETNLYAGVVPLLLALLAVAAVRSREVLFWTLFAIGAFFLTLGLNAPGGVFELIWRLPGFSVVRAPGRFSFLLVFGLAVLAAYGAHWLLRQEPALRRRPAWTRRWAPAAFVSALTLGFIAAIVVVGQMIEGNRADVARWLEANYLSLSAGRVGMTGARVAAVLAQNLSFNVYHTLIAAGSFIATAVILWGLALRPRWRPLWASALLTIASAGGVLYALDFHPLARLDDLTRPSPAIEFLQQQPGLDRHFVQSDWYRLQPNQLLPWGLSTPDGYSSLEPQRHDTYAEYLLRADDTLLDLAGVRWLVVPKAILNLPTYQGTGYFVRQPLIIGVPGNPNSVGEYRVPDVEATGMRMIGNYEARRRVPDGTPLVRVELWDQAERRLSYELVAGADLDIAVPPDRTAYAPPVQQATGRQFSVDRIDGTDRRVRGNLSLTQRTFPAPHTVWRVRLEALQPDVPVVVHGMALTTPAGPFQIQRELKAKYATVFEDPDVLVRENSEALPRAFVVRTAVVSGDPGHALNLMVMGRYDPTRVVVLERDAKVTVPPLPSGSADVPAREVRVMVHEDHRVVVEASSDGGFLVLTDSWFPGWRAFVDGEERPVLRGNYLFRAVPLEAGPHTIEFIYDPLSWRLGAGISIVTLTLIAAGLALVRLRRRQASD